jgi:hypothetical protein
MNSALPFYEADNVSRFDVCGLRERGIVGCWAAVQLFPDWSELHPYKGASSAAN